MGRLYSLCKSHCSSKLQCAAAIAKGSAPRISGETAQFKVGFARLCSKKGRKSGATSRLSRAIWGCRRSIPDVISISRWTHLYTSASISFADAAGPDHFCLIDTRLFICVFFAHLFPQCLLHFCKFSIYFCISFSKIQVCNLLMCIIFRFTRKSEIWLTFIEPSSEMTIEWPMVRVT